LLQNAAYILTPEPFTPADKVSQLSELLTLIGARVIIMQPREHDEAVAKISHLPHLMAASIIHNLEDNLFALSLAGGGLRDTTRTASSDPALWEDILLYNSASLVPEIKRIIKYLTDCAQALADGHGDALRSFLDTACTIKKSMPAKRPALDGTCDIVAIIPDQPGVIGQLGTLLGNNHVNIHDIQLLGVRDEDEGTVRLSVNRECAAIACELLKSHGFSAWIRE